MVNLLEDDADFIIKILRNEMKQLDEAYNETVRKANEIKSVLTKNAADAEGGKDDVRKINFYKLCDDAYTRSVGNIERTYKLKRAMYLKSIELLLCGSSSV